MEGFSFAGGVHWFYQWKSSCFAWGLGEGFLTFVIFFILCGIFILLVPILSNAYAQKINQNKKKRIAVLNFTANNTTEDIARIVRNNIELNLFKSNKFEVLEHDRLEYILKERKFLLSDCREETCALEIGHMLSAEYVIIGSVSKLKTYNILIKVLHVKTKQLIIADSTDIDKIENIRRVSLKLSNNVANEIEDLGTQKKQVERPIALYSSLHFQYASPISYLKDLVNPGFGLTISCGVEDILFKNFQLGFDFQYLYFNGKSNVTHHAVLIPATLTTGYRVPVGNLSIIPSVSAGASYDSVYYYTSLDKSSYSGDSTVQAVAKGGLALEYRFFSLFYVRIGSEYGAVFERDGRIEFWCSGFGAGVCF